MIETFIKKIPDYAACQWTGDNEDELYSFLGKSMLLIKNTKCIIVTDNLNKEINNGSPSLYVNVGDVIAINNSTKDINVYSKYMFNKLFMRKDEIQ